MRLALHPSTRRIAAVAAALMLGAAACAGPAGPDVAPEQTSPAPALPQTAWQGAPYEQVQDGGTLTMSIGTFPATFVFYHRDGPQGDLQLIQNPALSGALRYAADGSWTVNPDYAESITLTGRNPQRVTVKLNPRGVWSDGTPITYRDMTSNWAALNGSNPKFESASTAGYEDITAIKRGEDDYSYTVTFGNTNADWPTYVYPVLPASVTGTPQAFNNGYRTRMVPGNGPFVVASVDARAKLVTLERNPRWWGRAPRLERIVFRQANPATVGRAFANQEFDAVDTKANVNVLLQAQQRGDAVILKSRGRTWSHLTINGTKPPLDDVNVRRALAQTIDRQEFARISHQGLDVPPLTQGSVLLVPGQRGYEDIFASVLPHSREAAAQSLKRAGFVVNQRGELTKGGSPVTLKVSYQADTPTGVQRAQLLQQSLKELGIQAVVDAIPDSAFGTRVRSRDFQLITFTWTGDLWPLSSAKPLYFPADSPLNFAGITDPSLRATWDAVDAELDPAKRIELAHDLDRTIAGYVPIVPLASEPTVFAVKRGLVNIGAAQFETIDWTQVGYAG